MPGLFNFGGRSSAQKQQAPVQKPQPRQPRRRGIFGRLSENRDGTSWQDRLMMAGSALGGDIQPWQQHQENYSRQQEARQIAEGANNTAQKQRAEREQQADQLGLQGRERVLFLMNNDEWASNTGSNLYRDVTGGNYDITPDGPNYMPNVEGEAHNAIRREQLGINRRNVDSQISDRRASVANTNDQIRSRQETDRRAADVDASSRRGTVPPGYVERRSPDGSYSMQPIAGSPAALEAEFAERAPDNTANNIVLDDISRSADILRSNPGAGGFLGGVVQHAGGSKSDTLRGLYETITANVGFGQLQQMRNNSPTGAALGSVSDGERTALNSVLGSLRVDMDPQDQLYNLGRLNNIFLDIVHGPGNGPERIDPSRFGDEPEDDVTDLLDQYAPR